MSLLNRKSIRIMRMFAIVITALLLGYGLLVAFVYLRQAKMLYFPTRQIEASPADIGLPFDEITLRTPDGLKLSAWYIPAENAKGFLIFCHGNAGNISHRLDSIRIFHQLGLNVLIFDYRGYGRSEGEPTEKGTYLDAEAAYDFLVNTQGAAPSRIIIFGRSLGSAVAAELAVRRSAGALIIESGFTSVPDLGKKLFPHMPVRLISRFHYATIEKVGRQGLPKLFIHSPDDEIIPYAQGRKLFEVAAGPKEFLAIRGGHNEGFLISGDIYRSGLRRFISEYF
jgi:fermentation-respiration switch protein FrsA (DUF1100 family)